MDESNGALLEFAIDVAQRAGKVTLARFRRNVDVEWKSDRSPVTVADREAEECCRQLNERRFPEDVAAYSDWHGRADHLGGSGISTNRALDHSVRETLGISNAGGRPQPVAE